MGKYAATRAVQRSRQWREASRSAGNGFFGSINSESDFVLASFLYNADPTGIYRGYVASRDSTRYMRDYLNNHGLQWSDLRYPSLVHGFGSAGGFGSSAMMFSKNIASLYL